MYVEVPRELRDLVDELGIPKAEVARAAFLAAVKIKAGEKALGKRCEALSGKRRHAPSRPQGYSSQPSHRGRSDDFDGYPDFD